MGAAGWMVVQCCSLLQQPKFRCILKLGSHPSRPSSFREQPLKALAFPRQLVKTCKVMRRNSGRYIVGAALAGSTCLVPGDGMDMAVSRRTGYSTPPGCGRQILDERRGWREPQEHSIQETEAHLRQDKTTWHASVINEKRATCGAPCGRRMSRCALPPADAQRSPCRGRPDRRVEECV